MLPCWRANAAQASRRASSLCPAPTECVFLDLRRTAMRPLNQVIGGFFFLAFGLLIEKSIGVAHGVESGREFFVCFRINSVSRQPFVELNIAQDVCQV